MSPLLFSSSWKVRLTGRVALNVYFWAFILFLCFYINWNNEQLYHYGIIYDSWYLPVLLGMLVLQCTLMYVNNLWLMPRFWVRNRRVAYFGLLLLLNLSLSALTVVLQKAARPHLNIAEMQQPGFTVGALSEGWSWGSFGNELLPFFLGNLLWLFLFTMTWYRNDYVRQRRLLRAAEAARTQAELSFLKSQLNPHFLFNTLNNIYGLALHRSAEAPGAILKLSALLRYLLYESNGPAVSFSAEQAAIEAYVEIEGLRLPADARVSLSLSADADAPVPPLLWMPLLENCFKHGSRLLDLPVEIVFQYRIENNRMVIRSQNAFGAPVKGKAPAEGIGLSNLRRRLHLLFPNRHAFVRTEEAATVTYLLTIDLL